MERDENYLRAKKVENLKAFYIHLALYILVNLMLFINISSDSSKLWFYIHLQAGDWYRYTWFDNFSIRDIRKRGKNERLKNIWRKISKFIFGMYEYKSLQSNA